jgi:hypothetical protein
MSNDGFEDGQKNIKCNFMIQDRYNEINVF